MQEIKRWALCLLLGVLGLIPSFAQTPRDTVRSVLIGLNDPDKLIFTLKDRDGIMTVHLAGKPKTIAPGFYALDLRPGDTLTVAGVKKDVKRKTVRPQSELVSAAILGVDYVFDHDERPGYYFSLDQKPSFQGGDSNNFSRWVNANLVYPPASLNTGSEGKVRLQFTIEKDGKLDDVKVIQSSGDRHLDAEAFRVVSSSPDWQPGTLHGKPVKVTYTFPVIFQLKKKQKERTGPSGWSTGR